MSAAVQEARTRLMWAYFHTFAFQTAAAAPPPLGTDPGFRLAPHFQISLEEEICSELGGVRRIAGKKPNIATFVF